MATLFVRQVEVIGGALPLSFLACAGCTLIGAGSRFMTALFSALHR